MTYLDWAASAPPDPELIEIMARAATRYYGNPSARHGAGREARNALDEARSRCAGLLGCRPDQLTFTSGGTESNSIVILARLLSRAPGSVILSKLEHPSVSEPVRILGDRSWSVRELAPGPDGRLTPEQLADTLKKHPDTRLVAVMGVNNEIGSIQPLDQLVGTVRRAQEEGGRAIHFHADLVQAAGKVPLHLHRLDVDSASLSAHKFRGPRGIGLLYHKNPKIEVLLRGGGQERNVRPGTENVAGAVAMAAALDRYGTPSAAVTDNGTWLLDELIKTKNAVVIPAARRADSLHRVLPTDGASEGWTAASFVPGIISVAFPGIPGEVLARVLGESDFAVSTGSACRSNRKNKLPASMAALGVSRAEAEGMIRISIGPATAREELTEFIGSLGHHVDALSSPGAGGTRTGGR